MASRMGCKPGRKHFMVRSTKFAVNLAADSNARCPARPDGIPSGIPSAPPLDPVVCNHQLLALIPPGS